MTVWLPTQLHPLVQNIRKLCKQYWAFPIALLVLVCGLALFGVSGSSVGSYDGQVNDSSAHFGPLHTRPRAIRSDEWLVNTQMTIAQAKDGFPVVNKHVGNGQDMSVVLDVPYKEWSVLFKPQNLIFFVAPLNFAFAFKWWFLGAVLAFSVYALFLKFLPKQRLAAVLLGGSVFFAPMIQWWYQSITIMPVALGLLALCVLMSIHTEQHRRQKLLYLAALAYIVAAFALIMYPPFQIPVAVVIVFCYAAYCIAQWRTASDKQERTQLLKTIGMIAASVAIGCLFVGVYLLQHHAVIKTISDTAYPGHRDIAAGGYSVLHVASNFLLVFDQSTGSVMHYGELLGGSNQSEISSFLFPVIPLLLLGIYLLFRRKHGSKNPVAISLVAASCAALVLFLLRLFVSFGSPLYKLLALNLVPHNRLLIGIGFACIPLIIGSSYLIKKQPISVPKKYTAGLLGILAAAEFWVVRQVVHHDPGYVSHIIVAWCAVAATIGFVGFLLYGYLRLSMLVFFIFSFISTALANPLQHNLNEVTSSDFAHVIQSTVKRDPNGRWVSYKAVTFENYALASGAKTLGGTYSYPQLGLWHQIDPSGTQKDTYNRYAHVEFEFDDSVSKPQFILLAPDTFAVKLSACDPFLTTEQVRYIYSPDPLVSHCLQPLQSFKHPSANIYLYRRIVGTD